MYLLIIKIYNQWKIKFLINKFLQIRIQKLEKKEKKKEKIFIKL
jgi:hypothetical protein